MPFDQNRFNARMDRKYDILAEEAAAKTLTARTDASSLPGYRADLGFHARATGQQALEGAATEAARRYMDPDWLRGAARIMIESGQLPGYTNAPGAGAPGAGAPGAGPPAAGPPAPIQFQTLPEQPGYPLRLSAAPTSAATADVSQPPSILTSPTSVEDMTPEQLAQDAQAAAMRGVQTGPAAPATGPAAQRRLATAQSQLPSLLRPTSVPTSRVPATSPLYSTGFRRGTANVKPRGYAAGDEDVLLRKPLFGAAPGTPPGARAGGAGAGAGARTPGAGAPGLPPIGPAPMPMPGPMPLPMPMPGPSPGGYPNPAEAGRPNPDRGQPAGPGIGTPWDPNAMTGIPNMGGIVDATLRMVNPDRFEQALQNMRPSENIEDRRVNDPTMGPQGVLGTAANVASDIGGRIVSGGQALASDIWKVVAGDRAAPGSLQDQLGYNQIPGPTASGIVDQFVSGIGSTLGGLFGGSSATPIMEGGGSGDSGGGAFIGGGGSTEAPSEEWGSYRKGAANVKGKSKGDKGGGPPKGLEAILSMMAAMQGGGADGPPAGPPPAPGMKKGTADVKGHKKSSADVKGHKKGSANVKGKGDKSSKSAGDQLPEGLEAILPALLMAAKGGGAVGPQAADALPPPMRPGAAALPAFAHGTPEVQPMSNYPFGAGYLFGANEVPGQGTGKVDMVPAMLAPHEAVLNKAAADILGRGLIAALNSQGVKQMGMRRGATS